jgi:predicted PurR-regulated permease PerM
VARGEARRFGLREVLIAEVGAAGLVVALWVLNLLRHLELELVVAGVLALVIEPIVGRLQRVHVPRIAAVAVVVAGVLAGLVGLAAAFAVPLVAAGHRVVGALPGIIGRLRSHRAVIEAILAKLHLARLLDVGAQSIAHAAQVAVAPTLRIAEGAVGSLANLAVVATLTVFLSIEGPKAIAWTLDALAPARRERVARVLHDVAVAVAGYVLGNLATSVAAGLAVGVTYGLLGLPDPGLIGLWVGLVDLLPLVGGLAGGVPAVALALVGGVRAALIVAVVVIVYQQVENHLLNPIVYARTVRLSPLWVLVAILVGAQAASLPGALIAIPIASAVQVVAREVLRDPLRRWLGGGSLGAVLGEGTDAPPLGVHAGDELLEGLERGEGRPRGARDVGVVQEQGGAAGQTVGEVREDGGRRGPGSPVAPPARPEDEA